MRDSRRHDPRRSPLWERFALVAFVAAACWMLVDGQHFAAVRDLGIRVRAYFVPAGSVGTGSSALADEERTHYETELAATRAALVASVNALAAARAQLKDAHGLAEQLALGDAYRLIPARVIARSEPRERRRVIILARGTDDGVGPGMPVVSGAAFVGRVVSATARTSRVALSTDPSCRVLVSVVVPGSTPRAAGASAGTLGGIELRFVGVDAAPPVGALVVTAGAASRIPPGLVLGRVTAVDRAGDRYEAGVVVEPAVDADTLDVVHILDLGVPLAGTLELAPKSRPEGEAPAADPPGR